MEEMLSYRKHLAITEMELEILQGFDVLEIGSGGGAHSALFQKYGANVISIDITPERVLSTSKKLSLLNGSKGVAFLSDAENLPFRNESFDIVYSNGVLHHSENTEKCVEEVYRVLKPNAKAILMLYSRYSAHYWLNLFVKGVLTRAIFQYPEYEWLGRITEGKPVHGVTKNPVTRVYSRRQLVNLFKKYKIISLRKYDFDFGQLPITGQ
jgi:ubiquinone/menaquinone biosynthesis C-methylase UbiE